MAVTITRLSKANQIRKYMTSSNLLLVGIGGQRPWEIEGQPPALDAGLFYLPDLIGFVPVSRVAAVVPNEDGNLIIDGTERYFELDSVDPYEIATAGATKLYIEAQIDGDALPSLVYDYRCAGLFQDCSCTVPIYNSTQFIERSAVKRAYLDTIVTFEPVLRENNVVHTLKFIRDFN